MRGAKRSKEDVVLELGDVMTAYRDSVNCVYVVGLFVVKVKDTITISITEIYESHVTN